MDQSSIQTDLELLTSSYDYDLPQELIASEPARPADSAKLLVYERTSGQTIHTTFAHLLDFIPPQTHIFLNDTRVIKARIYGRKDTGGKVELLLNKPMDADRFLVMIKGRVHEGSRLEFDQGLSAAVLSLEDDGSRIVTFEHNGKRLRFDELVLILDKIGHIPLPPYIHREDKAEDEKDYQTLFAQKNGAVAAPTASLHFTPLLFEQMKSRYPTHTLTLHVGAGTFKPVEADNILEHPMHSEYYHIPNNAAKIIESDTKILAIGTTVARTIEHYTRTGKRRGECDLFLHPHNPPVRVDHLLTNFHLPKSTLIMLVSAFVGREKTLQLYKEAVAQSYRFFSYGDAMLIL